MGFLGIDVGGTKVALLGQDDANLSYEDSFAWPAPAGPVEADLELLAQRLSRFVTGCGVTIEAVGVAMPATIDVRGVVTVWPSRPAWSGVDLAAVLAELLPGARIAWADDGDLAGLAEARAAGLDNALYFGVGTGIGGGIVLNGQLVPGHARGSAELGHMVVDRAGPRCGCGRMGCLQAIASGPATLRRAAAARGGEVAYDDLRGGWERRDAWAVTAIEETCDALAAAAVSVNEMVRADAAVIGGGFAAGLRGFAAEVAVRAVAWSRQGHPAPPVHEARLGALSSLHGAVLLARALSP